MTDPQNPAKENPDGGEEGILPAKNNEPFTAGNQTPEIANNDGSIIETLDTVFHGSPGWSDGENISGSNRADYYEARSNGKSDVEEELDVIRERNRKDLEKGAS